eukprot:GHVH01007003.1.p1 GENE.GHVH01007003.1~~GHVH01007003.1.p1  ORF type:complete len:449 (-),score=54.58 GHVH01007003.1:81-1427(-)
MVFFTNSDDDILKNDYKVSPELGLPRSDLEKSVQFFQFPSPVHSKPSASKPAEYRPVNLDDSSSSDTYDVEGGQFCQSVSKSSEDDSGGLLLLSVDSEEAFDARSQSHKLAKGRLMTKVARRGSKRKPDLPERDLNSFKRGLYRRLAHWEATRIFGVKKCVSTGANSNYSMWLVMTGVIIGYAALATVNLSRVIIFQHGWSWLEVCSFICVVIFGYILGIVDLFTWMIARLDGEVDVFLITTENAQTKNERAEERKDKYRIGTHRVKRIGTHRVKTAKDESVIRTAHASTLLNPTYIRFIIYLNFFWILSGLISATSSLIFWAVKWRDMKMSAISYVYIFLPLILFLTLFIFRATVMAKLSECTYWRVDETYLSGRFPHYGITLQDMEHERELVAREKVNHQTRGVWETLKNATVLHIEQEPRALVDEGRNPSFTPVCFYEDGPRRYR